LNPRRACTLHRSSRINKCANVSVRCHRFNKTVRFTRLATLSLVLVLALLACGGDDEAEQPAGATTASQTRTAADESAAADDADALARRPDGEEGLRVPAQRARVVANESDFGRVLFDANDQAIYVFEIDGPDQSNCTSDECVRAWPPVLTEETPTAGAGVDAGLLGMIRRDDGALQVTYNERPLYFYEHEGPGEIKCHNVNLHGGLWWVVTPSGDPVS
jgi:predicted lipoprotein with Yx(FWY)xxD motif